ncbi:MAG: Ribosomal-protein-alanine N-acetyltransferase [Herbinix sp.]|jgi:ribosomal-protein-alanine N-acetyltransferase|nr:Ribosomal-protein-alanine N-acetyltransferase [Herbinix sp.]
MQRIYETERLILKVIDKNDVAAVLDYIDRNKDFLQEWEPYRCDEFYTKQFQQDLLENDFQKIHDKSLLRLWLYKKEDDKRIIGTLSFSDIIMGCFQSCHLGYKLDQTEINHGYITEAIRRGIDIIFQDYGLHRIEANIMPKNSRSLRVAEKLGFHNEGLAKQYLRINGIWEDHVHMVLLNEEL